MYNDVKNLLRVPPWCDFYKKSYVEAFWLCFVHIINISVQTPQKRRFLESDRPHPDKRQLTKLNREGLRGTNESQALCQRGRERNLHETNLQETKGEFKRLT